MPGAPRYSHPDSGHTANAETTPDRLNLTALYSYDTHDTNKPGPVGPASDESARTEPPAHQQDVNGGNDGKFSELSPLPPPRDFSDEDDDEDDGRSDGETISAEPLATSITGASAPATFDTNDLSDLSALSSDADLPGGMALNFSDGTPLTQRQQTLNFEATDDSADDDTMSEGDGEQSTQPAIPGPTNPENINPNTPSPNTSADTERGRADQSASLTPLTPLSSSDGE